MAGDTQQPLRPRLAARLVRAVILGSLALIAVAGFSGGANRPAQAQELTIFENGNTAAVESGPQTPTFVPLNQPYLVTYINTYHYFSGGMPPGQIGLRSQDTGIVYGPWQAVGQVGQGGVPNAYWVVRPNIPLPPGTYRIIDSHRPSWSTNAGSGYAGFATIKGMPSN